MISYLGIPTPPTEPCALGYKWMRGYVLLPSCLEGHGHDADPSAGRVGGHTWGSRSARGRPTAEEERLFSLSPWPCLAKDASWKSLHSWIEEIKVVNGATRNEMIEFIQPFGNVEGSFSWLPELSHALLFDVTASDHFPLRQTLGSSMGDTSSAMLLNDWIFGILSVSSCCTF